MLISQAMKNSSEEIKRLRAVVEASMNTTASLEQALAQLEATLLRKENQQVSEKSQKNRSCIKKFQTYNSYLRILKTNYK